MPTGVVAVPCMHGNGHIGQPICNTDLHVASVFSNPLSCMEQIGKGDLMSYQEWLVISRMRSSTMYCTKEKEGDYIISENDQSRI